MYRFILLITSLIFSSVINASSKNMDIAAATCAIVAETKVIESAFRVKEFNIARQSIGKPPFLDGDEEILRSLELGTCIALVLNSKDYEELSRAVEERILAEWEKEQKLKKEQELERRKKYAKKKAKELQQKTSLSLTKKS